LELSSFINGCFSQSSSRQYNPYVPLATSTDLSFYSQEKPIHYRSTWIAVIVSMVYVSCASLLLRFIMARENSRREASHAANVRTEVGDKADRSKGELLTGGPLAEEISDADSHQFADLTDKEQPGFRYSL
jgi:hypothetical protein